MITHIVRKGESLMSICRRYRISLNELEEANKDNLLMTVIGRELNIPITENNTIGLYEFRPGIIVKHFKRDLISEEEQKQNKYLYRVLAIAKHTETGEDMLVYQALYAPFETYTRPMSMVYEKAPIERYSEEERSKIKNVYRLEPYIEN